MKKEQKTNFYVNRNGIKTHAGWTTDDENVNEIQLNLNLGHKHINMISLLIQSTLEWKSYQFSLLFLYARILIKPALILVHLLPFNVELNFLWLHTCLLDFSSISTPLSSRV